MLVGGVGPRPIAFVGSYDKDGRPNLSPFSFFNVFGVNPPIACFSPAFSGKTGGAKDTFLNVSETKECTISIVTYDMVHQASLASAPYARGVDEFEKSGFTKFECERVKSFGVAESPFIMEAKLLQHVGFDGKPGTANLMICEILLIHVREDIFNEEVGAIDPHKIDQVARLGGPWYTRAKEGLFKLPQPAKALAGVDQLPEALRLSSVLTGSDLAKLASIEILPEFNADGSQLQDLARHTKAKEFLAAGSIDEAWKALLD